MSDLEAGAREAPRDAASPGAAFLRHRIVAGRLRNPARAARVEHALLMLSDNINEIFWVAYPRAAEVVYVSPAYEHIWGRSCDSVYAAPRSFLENIHEDDRPHVEAALRQQARGERTEIEYRVVRPDGSERWIRDRGFPVPGSGEDEILVAGIAEDITERRRGQTALQAQKERFSQCLRAARAGAWEWSVATNEAVWSDELFELLGLQPGSVSPTFDTWLAHVAPEDRERVLAEVERSIADNTDFNHQYRVLRADGSTFWCNDVGTVVRDESGRPRAMYGIQMDATERKDSETKMRDYESRLRSLAAELSRSEERQRRRLAETLHDGVVQSLAMTRIHLKQASARLQGDEGTATLLHSALELIERAVKESRQLTHEISPPILYELGLRAAVEWLGDQFSRAHGFRFEFEPGPGDFAVENEVRFTLFKAVQELMTNVVKHARATCVRVKVEDKNDAVTIIVSDDGCGFEPEHVGSRTDTSAFGLFNIRDRLDYLGGSCVVESAEGAGTRVVLRAPKHGAFGDRLAAPTSAERHA